MFLTPLTSSTPSRGIGKPNSLIVVTVFHHTAISVEHSPIDSLEILSSHSGFHRFRNGPHLRTPTPDGGKPVVSSRPKSSTMLQFVRNSLLSTHWKSSPSHPGFHHFCIALTHPTPTPNRGKANSLIAATVFHYVAICAELWPINSLEIVSSPPRISPISQRAVTLHTNPRSW